ncbi:hypothetical protein [Vibrio sp. TBV020]|uniref:hypothetical protein n=1 Tax=Vibrio sp. TBV020 TaxID=3137398 RepID=UPI0038CD4C86
MALTQTHKWLVVGGAALGAIYLGYTTLFPTTTSVYAEAPQEVEHVTINDPLTETAPSSVSPEFIQPEILADSGLQPQHASLLEQALNEKLAAQLAPPTERTEPLVLDAQALEYLTKSRDVALAELDAKLREQHGRAQPSAAISGLGLNAPMLPTGAQVTSAPLPSKPALPVMLGSVIQLADDSYSARLHYQGRWNKATKGTRIADLSVLSINESGVKVQLGSQRYHLLVGGGYE